MTMADVKASPIASQIMGRAALSLKSHAHLVERVTRARATFPIGGAWLTKVEADAGTVGADVGAALAVLLASLACSLAVGVPACSVGRGDRDARQGE